MTLPLLPLLPLQEAMASATYQQHQETTSWTAQRGCLRSLCTYSSRSKNWATVVNSTAALLGHAAALLAAARRIHLELVCKGLSRKDRGANCWCHVSRESKQGCTWCPPSSVAAATAQHS
jgi:hypothetical protein